MNQKQQRGPGGSGSSDIETGKPQDPRENRHPGESNLSQNPQHTQQNPQDKRGQHDEKQFGGQKGGSQQQGNDKGQQHKDGQQSQQGGQGHGQHENQGRQQDQGRGPGQQSQQGASTGEKQYGEGNYKASKDYNERTKQFVESGRVDQAAKDAAPKNEKESREMKDAEREGRRPMREEDPEINPDKQKMPGKGPDARS